MSAWFAIMLVGVSAARAPRKPKAAPETTLLAPGKPSEGPGQVTYVTSDTVFLDRGAADGVAAGSTVQVRRGGKTAGVCTVAQVTEHSATCVGAGQAGDRIAIVRKPVAPAQPLAAVPDARELAARMEVVQAEPNALVDFEGDEGVAGGGAAAFLSVVLSQTTFSNFVSGGGPYQLQRVDARLNDFKIWRGLHASVDVSALNWSRRPPNFASPYQASTQLFVRQLELRWHEPGTRFEAALGRIWVRGAPGVGVIDGAQAGVRTASGSLEGGAFGGFLPNALTLAPTLTQWTAGAYASAHLYSGSGADAFWLQPELRLDWAVRDGLGSRFELGAAVNAWVGRAFEAHLQAQGAAGGSSAPGLIDFARVDIGLRPTESLRFNVGARYHGNLAGEISEIGAPTPGARGAHAEAAGFFDAATFSLGVSAAYARDLETSLDQGRVGPQLNVPRLFGRAVGMGLGYSEEFGWLPGRSAWLQLSFVPVPRFRALARVSWFMQSANAAVLGVAGQELSLALSLELRVVSFFWVRFIGSGRQALSAPTASATDLEGAYPWRAGVTASLQLGLEL